MFTFKIDQKYGEPGSEPKITSVLDDLLDGPNPTETNIETYTIRDEKGTCVLSFEVYIKNNWASFHQTTSYGNICNIRLSASDYVNTLRNLFPDTTLESGKVNDTKFIGFLCSNMNENDQKDFLSKLTGSLGYNVNKYIPAELLSKDLSCETDTHYKPTFS